MDLEAYATRVIRAYEAQGWHRTGTNADVESAEWLAGLVRASGLEPALDRVELDRLDLRECYVEAGGRRIPGVPLFDAPATAATGVAGALSGGPEHDGILLVRTQPTGAQPELVALRRRSRAGAIVVITEGPRPGLALLNAPAFRAPFGPPVLQVSSLDAAPLLEAASAGETVRVVAHSERVPTLAFNVTVEVGPAGAPFVLGVNTPRSGWWGCAGERGGGLVCWLEALRTLASSPPRTGRVFFSATTGHELGHLGFDHLLSTRAEIAAMPSWVHFGANIGCATATRTNLMVSEETLASEAVEALRRHGARVPVPQIDVTGGGEMKTAREHGARRWVALTCDNALFHMVEDRAEANLDAPAVAAHARAFAEVCAGLAGA